MHYIDQLVFLALDGWLIIIWAWSHVVPCVFDAAIYIDRAYLALHSSLHGMNDMELNKINRKTNMFFISEVTFDCEPNGETIVPYLFDHVTNICNLRYFYRREFKLADMPIRRVWRWTTETDLKEDTTVHWSLDVVYIFEMFIFSLANCKSIWILFELYMNRICNMSMTSLTFPSYLCVFYFYLVISKQFKSGSLEQNLDHLGRGIFLFFFWQIENLHDYFMIQQFTKWLSSSICFLFKQTWF